jgi:hypothetical protein
MFLGFEDVATKWFSSVMAQVHWVYCVSILLNSKEIEVPKKLKSLAEKQQWITKIVENKEKVEYSNSLLELMEHSITKPRYSRLYNPFDH